MDSQSQKNLEIIAQFQWYADGGDKKRIVAYDLDALQACYAVLPEGDRQRAFGRKMLRRIRELEKEEHQNRGVFGEVIKSLHLVIPIIALIWALIAWFVSLLT